MTISGDVIYHKQCLAIKFEFKMRVISTLMQTTFCRQLVPMLENCDFELQPVILVVLYVIDCRLLNGRLA
jgi:hypothetical protein